MRIPFAQRRRLLFFVCILLVLFWMALENQVFARAGGGKSSGSRGYSSGRSHQANPSVTPNTAPQQREYQQPRQQSQPPPTSTGRSFLSGMAGGLLGGILGGMLFRSLGFAGGPEGGGGFGFGDILILLIILGIIYFLVKRFRARQALQMSAAGAGSLPYSFPQPSPVPTYVPPVPEERIEDPKVEGLRNIKAMDPYFSESSFKDLAEDNFFKIQSAWTKRDMRGVSHLLNPEMLNTFQKDATQLLSQKKMNRLENIAVREVEIVDAGQDRGEEFITVKFYANLLDYVVDETNIQIVSGSSTDPVKFIEYWTFCRNVGEKNWVLAGITQEADFRA